MASPSGRWDRQAIVSGIAVCLLLAVPLTLLAAFVDSDNSGTNAAFFFGAMFGFVLGSGCAAWLQDRGTPMSHGVLAGLIAYIGAQTIFITVALIGSRDINWFGVLFTVSLVVLAGIIGGMLGSQLQARGFVPSSRRTSS